MKKETKILLAKLAIGTVSGVAVAGLVVAAVKNIVPMDESLTKAGKVMYKIGTIVIGGLVATTAAEYTDDIIDSVVSLYDPNVWTEAFKTE